MEVFRRLLEPEIILSHTTIAAELNTFTSLARMDDVTRANIAALDREFLNKKAEYVNKSLNVRDRVNYRMMLHAMQYRLWAILSAWQTEMDDSASGSDANDGEIRPASPVNPFVVKSRNPHMVRKPTTLSVVEGAASRTSL